LTTKLQKVARQNTHHSSKGEAKMAKNETLSEEEVSQGYILTCQAYAMTDTIKVRF